MLNLKLVPLSAQWMPGVMERFRFCFMVEEDMSDEYDSIVLRVDNACFTTALLLLLDLM